MKFGYNPTTGEATVDFELEQTVEEVYQRALADLERARAEFDMALAAYAREYAEGEMADAGVED